MSKMEDRLRIILEEKSIESQKNLDKQITGIFLFGFMCGIIFSYSSMIGYIGGFLVGIVVRNNLTKQSNEYVERTVVLFTNVIYSAKKMLKID